MKRLTFKTPPNGHLFSFPQPKNQKITEKILQEKKDKEDPTMDGFINNFPSPSPPRPSSPIDFQQRIRSPKEFKENGQDSYSRMRSNLPKKSATKHFMSPTVSAASKTVIPRKKILGESNEVPGSVSWDIYFHRSPHPFSPSLDSPSDQISTQLTPLSSRVTDPDQLGSNSYDPQTNYLSPRPKFLRYNPNRRAEILQRRENELRKRGEGFGLSPCTKKVAGEESSFDSLQSASSLERSVSQEDEFRQSAARLGPQGLENEDEEDEEAEDVEEEGCWHFKKVLNFLIVIGVLILSTLYIPSMNSPTPPPSIQAFRSLKEGYKKIQSHVLTASNDFVLGYSFFDGAEEKGDKLMETRERVISEGVKNEEMVELEMEKQGEGSEKMEKMELVGIEVKSDEEDHTGISMAEAELVNSEDDPLKETAEISDTDNEKLSFPGPEMKSDGDVLAETVEAGLVHCSEDRVRDVFELNELPPEEATDEEMKTDETVQHESEIEVDLIGEGVREKEEISKLLKVPPIESGIDDQGIVSAKSVVEVTSFESSQIVSLGISALSVVAVWMVLRSAYLKLRKPPVTNSSPTTLSVESTLVEDRGSILRSEKKALKEQTSEGDFNVHPSFTISSLAKGSPDRTQAPVVELLGEYVVHGNSFKRSNMISKLIESEESNFSQSQEKKRPRQRGMAPTKHNYQSFSELSATDSPSYGRVVVEEKIVTKEQENKGRAEVTKVVTTPVRRSCRIRNRAVSP